jgi:hypothetical protein
VARAAEIAVKGVVAHRSTVRLLRFATFMIVVTFPSIRTTPRFMHGARAFASRAFRSVFEVHYTPNGIRETPDQTMVAFR